MCIAGRAAGSYHNQQGSGVNYQCMPIIPEYNSNAFIGRAAGLASVEYQSSSYGVFEDDAHHQNAPCAVCKTKNRPMLVTIPAKRSCPDGWTKEYEGIDLLY